MSTRDRKRGSRNRRHSRSFCAGLCRKSRPFTCSRRRSRRRGVAGPRRRRADVDGSSGEFRYRTKAGTLRVSGGSFFQVNRFLVEELTGIVTGGRSGEIALDLYAGVGLFSLALASSFRHVVAVESSQGSAADLKYNSPRNVKAVRSTVDAYLAGQGLKVRPDYVVVDPPRAGLGDRVARALAKLGAPRVTYVSCDPATLARDLDRADRRRLPRRQLAPDRSVSADVSHRKRRGTGSLAFRSHGRSVPREGHFVFRQHPQTNAPADALGRTRLWRRIVCGVYSWRPPVWWLVAAVAFSLAALYFAETALVDGDFLSRWALSLGSAHCPSSYEMGALLMTTSCWSSPPERTSL